jgi:hypothetical protein
MICYDVCFFVFDKRARTLEYFEERSRTDALECRLDSKIARRSDNRGAPSAPRNVNQLNPGL